MAKLAEMIKADLIKEFKSFSDEMEIAVEECIRNCGSCRVSLDDRFEVGWKNISQSNIRVPARLVSIIENEYCFQGFRIEHHYTPAGRLHAISIKL